MFFSWVFIKVGSVSCHFTVLLILFPFRIVELFFSVLKIFLLLIVCGMNLFINLSIYRESQKDQFKMCRMSVNIYNYFDQNKNKISVICTYPYRNHTNIFNYWTLVLQSTPFLIITCKMLSILFNHNLFLTIYEK